MKIIAIIPARGDSKRIPRKNIKKLAGRPLIAYTLKEALKSKKLDRVIVSTEDKKIAKISKEYGAEIIERPIELAKDDSPSIDAVFNVMEQLEKDYNETTIIVLLQPTSPFRTVNDINNSVNLFLKKKCESVLSVYEISELPRWCLKIDKGYLKLIFNKNDSTMRIKDFDKMYYINGAIYIAKLETLYKCKSFFCESSVPYIMPIERSLDIDDEYDFVLAEFLVKKFGYDKDFH